MARSKKDKDTPAADPKASEKDEIATPEAVEGADAAGAVDPDLMKPGGFDDDGVEDAAESGEEPPALDPEAEPVVPEGDKVEDATPVDEADAIDLPEAAPEEKPEPEPEPEPAFAGERPASAPTPAPQPASSGGGVMAMLLGGVAAAAIGFLAAQYANGGWPFAAADTGTAEFRESVETRVAAAESAAQGAQEAAAAAVQAGDLTSLKDGLAALREDVTGLGTRLDAVDARFAELTTRLDTLEKRPISEGVSDEAIAAYERELDTLREAIAAQRAEVEKMSEDAAAMEANAEETARRTMARAALTRVRTAIDSGEPFAGAVQDMREAGVEPPALLADVAESGVITRSALQARFPDAARAALRAWRNDTSEDGGGAGGFWNTINDQLGVRSVTPREGDDPDAILSRAEAAVREGRLTDALAEIETLPDSARAALDAWEADARRRLEIRRAVDDLAQSLNQG